MNYFKCAGCGGIVERDMMIAGIAGQGSEADQVWHLYCYHTREYVEWMNHSENPPRKSTPEEIREHIEWAKRTYKKPVTAD